MRFSAPGEMMLLYFLHQCAGGFVVPLLEDAIEAAGTLGVVVNGEPSRGAGIDGGSGMNISFCAPGRQSG